MATALTIDSLHRTINNRLAAEALGGRLLTGIIGDAPSHYSKSPALWNAAFHHLGMDAVYLPFDVGDGQVGELLKLLRQSEQFLGLNVTVPHKVRVIDFLDGLDPGAARIGAVNTVVRDASGKLTGYNTDGEGFIDSLLKPSAAGDAPFMNSLAGLDALLLGAGGSARAVAFHLSDHLAGGRLIVANRTVKHAAELAGEIAKLGRPAIGIDEAAVADWAPKVELIVNSTTKGQGGLRKLSGGMATLLESYSALAPANPPALAESLGSEFEAQWRALAGDDVARNNRESERLAAAAPSSARFYDLIYHPEETVFLRHGRAAGHPTMNGKAMIVRQAVIALCRRVCRDRLQALGKAGAGVEEEIAALMRAAW